MTYHQRPCSAILESSMRPVGKVSGNDSSAVWQCMSWGYENNPRNVEPSHNVGVRYHLSQSAQLESNRNLITKCECCEDGAYIDTSAGQYLGQSERGVNSGHIQNGQGQSPRQQGGKVNLKSYTQKQKQIRGGANTNAGTQQKQTIKNTGNQGKQGSKARSPRVQIAEPKYDRLAVEETKKRRLNQLMKSKQKSLERIKVQEYVDSQKPFTRGMSNTRFRTFFGKQCMEAYGRNNTNQPIGGIIYGNHLKTFNINPHSTSNDPKYYQTHNTALNFAKRTKLDEQKNWKLLQKQFGKQLQLNSANQTLVLGKDVVYQQVTPNNMYTAMKVNHEFAKNNREEIRQQEKDYKRNEVLKQWAKQDEYKAQRAADKQTLKNAAFGSTMAGSEAEDEFRKGTGAPEQSFNRQVIYKLVDANGNIRYGADRHSLTCFVDMNFPENYAAYTTEMINRSPIFPIKVKEEDKNLDQIRKENYVESVVNNYPAHYLVPNVDYSKVVLRPKADKQRSRSRSPPRQKRPQSHNPKITTKPQTAGQVHGQPIFQNTKVGANINNPSRGNVVNSPKNQIKTKAQLQGNDKANYFNQSTKMSLGNTYGNQTKQQGQTGNNKYPPETGYANQSSQEASTRYAASLKNALLDQSTKNPHFATQLLVRASENINSVPGRNQRVVNQQYDARNYYPHANHEMKPQLYQHVKASKIPYAGVESNILDAIH